MIIARLGKDTIIGEKAEDIVMQMKLEDWTNYNSPKDYKENIGRRVEIYNGRRISYTTDDEFIDELQRIGVIDVILREV